MTKCPNCFGGFISQTSRFNLWHIPCDICGGLGELPSRFTVCPGCNGEGRLPKQKVEENRWIIPRCHLCGGVGAINKKELGEKGMTKKYSVRVPVTGIVTVVVPGQSEEDAISNAYYAIEENQSLSIKSDDFQKIESVGFIEWDDPPRCTLIED